MMRLGGDPMEAVPLTQASNTGEGRGPGEIGNAHLGAGSVCKTQTVVVCGKKTVLPLAARFFLCADEIHNSGHEKGEHVRGPLLFGAWLGTGVLIRST